MPHPLPVPLRLVIQQRAHRGENAADIAAALGLAPRTVRHLIQRWRDSDSPDVVPSYRSCTAPQAFLVRRFLDRAVQMRREHPTWGAGLIRVFLQREQSQDPLPTERTLQRWFQDAGLSPAPRGRRPAANPLRAQRPHETWQMDAAERVPLKDGTQVCWLRIADEGSGAVLETVVFPPGPLERCARH